MKWVAICDTVVDIEQYRLFMLDGCSITGLNEYENGDSRITEEIARFPTNEQASEAFLDLAEVLSGLTPA